MNVEKYTIQAQRRTGGALNWESVDNGGAASLRLARHYMAELRRVARASGFVSEPLRVVETATGRVARGA